VTDVDLDEDDLDAIEEEMDGSSRPTTTLSARSGPVRRPKRSTPTTRYKLQILDEGSRRRGGHLLRAGRLAGPLSGPHVESTGDRGDDPLGGLGGLLAR